MANLWRKGPHNPQIARAEQGLPDTPNAKTPFECKRRKHCVSTVFKAYFERCLLLFQRTRNVTKSNRPPRQYVQAFSPFPTERSVVTIRWQRNSRRHRFSSYLVKLNIRKTPKSPPNLSGENIALAQFSELNSKGFTYILNLRNTLKIKVYRKMHCQPNVTIVRPVPRGSMSRLFPHKQRFQPERSKGYPTSTP